MSDEGEQETGKDGLKGTVKARKLQNSFASSSNPEEGTDQGKLNEVRARLVVLILDGRAELQRLSAKVAEWEAEYRKVSKLMEGIGGKCIHQPQLRALPNCDPQAGTQDATQPNCDPLPSQAGTQDATQEDKKLEKDGKCAFDKKKKKGPGMNPFLKLKLDSDETSGVQWENKLEMSFSLPWTYLTNRAWKSTYENLYLEWHSANWEEREPDNANSLCDLDAIDQILEGADAVQAQYLEKIKKLKHAFKIALFSEASGITQYKGSCKDRLYFVFDF